jgi:Phage portal protein.
MTLRNTISSLLGRTPGDEAAQPGLKPKSHIVISTGKRRKLFQEERRTPEILKKWWAIYEKGGLYAQAIDTYALAAFANGYKFVGDEKLVGEVEANFKTFDFDAIGMQAIIHSLIFGDSFQEAVPDQSSGGIPVGILLRDSSSFEILKDDKGRLQGYTQILKGRSDVKLTPAQIVHLQITPSLDEYGLSLIGRAYDDIMRDAKTAEASATAIDRHGFPKWHIKVGVIGEDVEDEVLEKISQGFEDIETDNEFTSTADVVIEPLNPDGIQGIEEYSNISLMRVAAAMGMPEELLGLRRGSTDATSVSRVETFLRTRIGAIQRVVARSYTLGYIDQIVPPGSVKLVFNDVREGDEFRKAEWIGKLIGSIAHTSPDILPQLLEIFPVEWIQSQFNIDGESDDAAKKNRSKEQTERKSKQDAQMAAELELTKSKSAVYDQLTKVP